MITYNTGIDEVKIIKILRLSSNIRNWTVKLCNITRDTYIRDGYRFDRKAADFIRYNINIDTLFIENITDDDIETFKALLKIVFISGEE